MATRLKSNVSKNGDNMIYTIEIETDVEEDANAIFEIIQHPKEVLASIKGIGNNQSGFMITKKQISAILGFAEILNSVHAENGADEDIVELADELNKMGMKMESIMKSIAAESAVTQD